MHLWGWFIDLDGARGGNGYGPNPIGWGDINAWANLTGASPTPREVALLKQLDRLYLTILAEKE